MCTISVIFDYGRERIGVERWTPETFDQFKKILEEAAKLDTVLGEPDCEDPKKAEWMKEVERRLDALEDQNRTY